jgi:hypothetical protein
LWTLDAPGVDKVLILSIKTKVHAIGPGVIEGLLKGIDIAERDYAGLVIWSPDEPFSYGADLQAIPATAELIGADRLPRLDKARGPHDSHKGSFGDVMVIGGAQRGGSSMAGAAVLAARAALHSGAGRVYLHLLGEPTLDNDPVQPELMFRSSLPADDDRLCLVCGCGGGTGKHVANARADRDGLREHRGRRAFACFNAREEAGAEVGADALLRQPRRDVARALQVGPELRAWLAGREVVEHERATTRGQAAVEVFREFVLAGAAVHVASHTLMSRLTRDLKRWRARNSRVDTVLTGQPRIADASS